MRDPSVKEQIMQRIAWRTGATIKRNTAFTRNMTTTDYRRILHYIEDLEVQRDEAVQRLAEAQKQEATK